MKRIERSGADGSIGLAEGLGSADGEGSSVGLGVGLGLGSSVGLGSADGSIVAEGNALAVAPAEGETPGLRPGDETAMRVGLAAGPAGRGERSRTTAAAAPTMTTSRKARNWLTRCQSRLLMDQPSRASAAR
jgi:hypothetical protein